jgi:hypothetical protein
VALLEVDHAVLEFHPVPVPSQKRLMADAYEPKNADAVRDKSEQQRRQAAGRRQRVLWDLVR